MRMLCKAGLVGLSLATMVAASSAMAQVRYEASLSNTDAKDWSVSSSKISCVLSYNINGYGRADFVLLSGSEHRLSLELFPAVGIVSHSTMHVVSAPPEWRPHGEEHALGELELYRGFRPFMGDTVSWSILRELSNGQRILLPYTTENPRFTESIVPVLSPIGFSGPYREFLDCNAQLLPVGFNDVGLIAVMFYDQEERLTPTSKARLESQIEYAKLDKAISKIVISAFGSGFVDNLDNIELAKKRGEAIVKAYTDAGFPKELLEVKTFGDEQLATTGYTASDRQKSSKAVIEIQRDPFKVDRRQEVDIPDVGIPDEWR